jgi:hypothetical protein
MIPAEVLTQLSDLLSEYGTSLDQWEIVRASDIGNSQLPKTHTADCSMSHRPWCDCGAVDYAAVTIDVQYNDRGHRALFGVNDDMEVSLWMD